MGRDARSRGTVAETPKQAELTDAQLAQIHTDTSRMDRGERIAFWDKRQAKNFYGGAPYGPDVMLCPNDPTHGALQMAGSGTVLICQERKHGAWCTGTMPVSQ